VDLSIPIVIVQHIQADSDSYFINYLNKISQLNVKEAEDKEKPKSGNVYIAPPDYHLLIEQDRTFSLSVDKKVNYSRPSIDVLFESAVDVFKDRVAGVILTGANSDGANGLKRISEIGGISIIQSPKSSEYPAMPEAAAKLIKTNHITDPKMIAHIINNLNNTEDKQED
jgi:two-component system chemotaxis response regulator CheB